MASRAVEWWRLNVLAYYYGVILAWRSALGRYFVFRDMPQWFVEIMAADYCSDGEENEVIKRLTAEAREELRLRIIQKARENLNERPSY